MSSRGGKSSALADGLSSRVKVEVEDADDASSASTDDEEGGTATTAKSDAQEIQLLGVRMEAKREAVKSEGHTAGFADAELESFWQIQSIVSIRRSIKIRQDTGPLSKVSKSKPSK